MRTRMRMRRVLVDRVNEAIAVGDFLGKENKKEGSIPKSLGMLDLGSVVVNQPKFLKKDGETQPIKGGSPMAEVFELHVMSGKKNNIKIHGTIWIQCGGFPRMNIFQRSRLNPQVVDRKDSLELGCHISKAFAAFDHIFVYFHLMEGRNDAVVDTFMMWNPFAHCLDSIYNEAYKGKSSSVMWRMSHVVYKVAVVATIEIKFKPSTSNSGLVVGLGGTITASSNMFPDWKIILFSQKRNVGEYQSVENLGEQQEVLLPLLRSAVAVPHHSLSIQDCKEGFCHERTVDGCLLIDVNLVNIHDGGLVAKGVLKFAVENYGEYVGTILSKFGEMQVEVSFVDFFVHYDSLCPPFARVKKRVIQ